MSVIDKTFDIIESVQEHEDGLSLSALAQITGLKSSTVHRICGDLVRRGYLYQRKKRDNYLLGLKFVQLRTIDTSSSLKEQASPFLNKLCELTSETVMLAVYFGVTVITIDVILPKQVLMTVPDSKGGRYPLHCTSLGKILLAYMPEQLVENTIETMGLKAFTDNSITDESQLKQELEDIRRDDIAYDEEEYLPGVMSVASPIKDRNCELLAGVAIIAPKSRVTKLKLRQLGSLLKKTASELSLSLEQANK